MKKNELRMFMFVENGMGEMFIVFNNDNNDDGRWVLVRNALVSGGENFALESCEFTDELVHIKEPTLSIIKVYDSVKLVTPFELNADELFKKYNPKLLWERKPSPVSKKVLKGFKSEKVAMKYIKSIVPPYIIVD